ncbi:MAG: protein-export chaperone SecB [Hyphomicrobiales bacterium]
MAKAPKSTKKGEVNGANEAAKPAAAPAAPDLTAAAPAPGAQPSMKVIVQYLKDLSFENPNAPQSMTLQTQPEINIAVNVNAKPMGQPTDFEVELHLEAKATNQGRVVFAADLLYAGVFRLENIPKEALHPIVLIECPRMLFPFARQILADATRSGGFPPLMLDPIDFASMYQRRLAEQQKSATA